MLLHNLSVACCPSSLWRLRQRHRDSVSLPPPLGSAFLGFAPFWGWLCHGDGKAAAGAPCTSSRPRIPGPKLGHVPTPNQCLNVPAGQSPGGPRATPGAEGAVRSTQTTWAGRVQGWGLQENGVLLSEEERKRAAQVKPFVFTSRPHDKISSESPGRVAPLVRAKVVLMPGLRV